MADIGVFLVRPDLGFAQERHCPLATEAIDDGDFIEMEDDVGVGIEHPRFLTVFDAESRQQIGDYPPNSGKR